MVVISVDWSDADASIRHQMQSHLEALRAAGAKVLEVESDADDLLISTTDALCEYLADRGLGEGHAVNPRDVVQLKLPTSPLNPRQQGVLGKAFQRLVETGILEQQSNERLILTELGARHLYPT